MTTAYAVYKFYLKPADLHGQPQAVTVEAATVEDVFNPRIKRNEQRIVLRFANRHKLLACNKTQAEAMIAIAGTDEIEKWVGQAITITPARTPKGQDTITITIGQPKPANGNGKAKPAPVMVKPNGSSKQAEPVEARPAPVAQADPIAEAQPEHLAADTANGQAATIAALFDEKPW